jgi:hypothetical protein
MSGWSKRCCGFAQTADREFAVENGEGRLIGTLALLDLVLAEEGGR